MAAGLIFWMGSKVNWVWVFLTTISNTFFLVELPRFACGVGSRYTVAGDSPISVLNNSLSFVFLEGDPIAKLPFLLLKLFDFTDPTSEALLFARLFFLKWVNAEAYLCYFILKFSYVSSYVYGCS